MKKKLLLAFLLLVALLTITSGVRDVNSNAAPLGSTGAPGEQTCAKSGCHTGSAINTGKAKLFLDFGNALSTYEPGKEYTITVSLQQQAIQRFGFQVLALDDNRLNTGTLLVTDSIRTQAQQGLGPYTGRSYITYRYPGTEPYGNGLGQWTFKWKAPDNYNGNITFYAAAVAANNDGTDAGDTVYTHQAAVSRSVTGIEQVAAAALQVNIFPNPAHQWVRVVYTVAQTANTVIRLTGVNGKDVLPPTARHDAAGVQQMELNTSAIAPGTYLLSVLSGGSAQSKRLIIQ
jgi:hypothetical protein